MMRELAHRLDLQDVTVTWKPEDRKWYAQAYRLKKEPGEPFRLPGQRWGAAADLPQKALKLLDQTITAEVSEQ